MIDLDAVLSNADWAKRTPDKLSDLEQIAKKGSEKSDEQAAYSKPKPKRKPRKRKADDGEV